MVGLSRQIQQLGKCERPRLIFHLIVLLLFVSGVLLLVFLLKETETLSFGEDFLVVSDYINVSVTTSPPV